MWPVARWEPPADQAAQGACGGEDDDVVLESESLSSTRTSSRRPSRATFGLHVFDTLFP